MALLLDDFDLPTILAPIAGDKPAGTDPRDDISPTSPYFRLRDARAGARELERQAESVTDGDADQTDAAASAPWRTVRSLAETVLRENAKDLEVATWLTEALVRAAGLRGLATGAAVITGLVQNFWDDLYPMPDEDGIETRVGPLAGLSGQGVDGTLMQPLRKVGLFRRADGSWFGFWQYELSVQLSGISDPARRQQKIDTGIVVFEDVEKEARRSAPAYWSGLQTEIASALEAWGEMSALLDSHAGAVSPSTSRVRDLLVDMASAAARFAPKGAVVADPAAAPQAPGPEGGAAPTAALGAVMGREGALQQLGEIAAWFKRNEPNSPLAYTLDEAVRRGRMSWPELVSELMPDETARNALLVSLGIKPTVESTE